MAAGPFAIAADGVRVAVRLMPKASRTRVEGATGGAIKASVTAVPEKGKANAALIGLLAKEWRVPKTAITIAAGAADRNKVLCVAPKGEDAAELLSRLESWLEGYA